VHLPGRENRLKEPPYDRLGVMIPRLAEAMERYFDKPFAFFGHSMGALISFELSRELRRSYGVTPVCLFASAFRAPRLPDKHRPIHDFPDDQLVQELLGRYNGIPEVVLRDSELMQLYLPILRADLALLETYSYEPGVPLNCPISVYGGVGDSEVDRTELEAWSQQTSGSFKLQMFQGDHFFLNTNRDPLLLAITADLEQYAG
jgi:medium-chain acyl-[acyl-carrier-protein] hydrolase